MPAAVRAMTEADIPACARINRRAFAAHFGLDNPDDFRAGADVIGPRLRAWPEAGLVLEDGGETVGAALMMKWGTVCILGPVMVDPDAQSRGHARQLVTRLTEIADDAKAAFTGLFTFPDSAKHVRLYEQFGFRLQRITAIMSKDPAPSDGGDEDFRLFSALNDDGRRLALGDARACAETAFPGLDLSVEIRSIAAEGLGDTVLLMDRGRVAGFACCHVGEGSEASRGQLLVKFGLVRPGARAAESFRRLLGACEAYAADKGVARIVAGTNAGRTGAYRLMQATGFRTDLNGVAMIRPGTTSLSEGYNRPDIFAIDDWR